MEHLGVTAEQAYELITRAVELAKRARSLYLEEFQHFVQNGNNAILYLTTSDYLGVLKISYKSKYLYTPCLIS